MAGDVTVNIGGNVSGQLIIGDGDNQLTYGRGGQSDRESSGGQSSVAGRPNNLPFSRAREFVGREASLTALHARVNQEMPVAITAVQGMGGIGKSELALQYADKYNGSYGGHSAG